MGASGLFVVFLILRDLVTGGTAPTPQAPWSFHQVAPPTPPEARSHPVDAFIQATLERKQLESAPITDRYTLIRRAYFDLIGLPPSPEEVQAFVADASPDSWSQLINHLLESPHYGERWARHWLDVARYADSGGYETDIYYRNSWKYRDYVIRSFNQDKPYDRFLQEQIAGDELWPGNLDLDPKRVYYPSDDQQTRLEARTATGFFSLGPRIHESALDAKRLRYETLTDWVDTLGSAFLGLTVGCARCHDHKFDPISQKDYFALQAVFAGTRVVEEATLTAMEIADREQHYPRILALEEARRAYRNFEAAHPGERTDAQRKEHQRLRDAIVNAVLSVPEKATGLPHSPFEGLLEIPTVSVLSSELPPLVKPVHRLDRGELARAREPVKAALPGALAKATDTPSKLPYPTGGRQALALWMTQPDHPLTARVMVNRIWQWHFGRGLVETANDFGTHGTPPSHPELLDWLAHEFVQRGWSLKAMHRLLMTSNAYQRDSRFASPEHLRQDPDNRFLWRMNRRRLEAEILWDNVHAVSGTLNRTIGGRPVFPPLAADELAALRDRWHWPVSADPKSHTRRGIYIVVRRNFRFPMFEMFDAPVPAVSCPSRSVTTVAPQALWNLNNASVHLQAKHLAERIVAQTKGDREQSLTALWWAALSRPPTEQELTEASAYLDKPTPSPGPLTKARLAPLCLAMFNLTEFAFID